MNASTGPKTARQTGNQNNQKWMPWLRLHRQYWTLLILAVLGLALGRLALMMGQAPAQWHPSGQDITRAFWMGARFDIKNLAVLLGLPLFLAFLMPAGLRRFWQKLLSGWQVLVMLLLNLLMVVNYYYFQFYNSPINGLIFGIAEDDTAAVSLTLWNDFPVIWLVGGILLLTAIQVFIARWWARRLSTGLSGWRLAALAIASLLLTAGLARGSLGTFPLRTMHMAVSSDALVNNLVPNGWVALQMAWKERNASDMGSTPEAGMKFYGLESLQDALQQAGLQSADESLNAAQAAERARNALQQTLPPQEAWQQARQPNVLVAVMEGWGRHLLEYDDPARNDLLGRLRPWLHGKADYFSQALSYQHGTYQSLEGLLLDSPITPLMQSRYGYHGYSSSVAQAYRDAGYQTVFLSAGQDSWRKLDTALLQQGFDQVLGESAILERYPQATTHTWGVDDEWMFRYARDIVAQAEAAGKPLMLVMLTTTNHPPFRTPPGYQPAVLDPGTLGSAMAVDAEQGRTIMSTYQYANDALGHFLDQLDSDGVMAHTLFAATGDHNTRQIFAYPDASQLNFKYGVPIIIWLPEPYRLGGQAHTGEWASHQDIFATLMAHSLQDTRIATRGRDLYADTAAPVALSFIGDDAAAGMGVFISAEGAVIGMEHPQFYHWGADGKLQAAAAPSYALQTQWQKQRAELALRDWRIRSEALQSPPPLPDARPPAAHTSTDNKAAATID
ncbi:LTA synthase family protein [Kerstersia sp.]|uniref:LTA synthase family protein n=1 Tax=Kerstersia sp. TaxID=1930783 RepID=UPI003F92B064